jgi:hypothetical protein
MNIDSSIPRLRRHSRGHLSPGLLLALAFPLLYVMSGLQLAAQTAEWTGDDGNWSADGSWSPSGVPDATGVLLGDVASGTRTITYDSSNPDITSLALTQTTAGAVNTLTLSDTLTLTGTGPNVFNQTLGEGVGAGGIVVNLNTGGLIDLTASSAKSFANAGTLNLAGGGVSFTASVISAQPTFTNTGIVNSSGGSIVSVNTHSSTGGNPAFTINNGLEEGSGAQFNFTAGTTLLGRTVDGDRGAFNLNNYGAISIAGGATVSLNNRVEATGSSFGVITTLDNKAGAALVLGSATESGSAVIEFTRDGNAPTNSSWSYALANSGTVSIYGQSKILNSSLGAMNGLALTNNNGGILNLVGDATGILIGGDAASNIDVRLNLSLVNDGIVNVQIFAGAATGVTRFGNFSTAGNARGAVTIDNHATFTIAPNATFLVQSAYGGSEARDNRFTNAATGTLTLGVAESTTTGATLQFAVGRGRSAGSPTVFNYTQFQNDGTATLHGTSVIERSATINMQLGETAFVFSNNAGARLNLHDTARIGNTARAMLFSNAGTLTKWDASTSTIASAAAGTAVNTGTIHVKEAGELAFTNTLDTSAATSVLRFDIGAASAGRLTTGGDLVLGEGGATLELVFTTANLASSYDLLEFGSITGSFAAVTLSGSGLDGTLARDNGVWTGNINGYTFSFVENTGILSITGAIPEPSTCILLFGALAFLAAALRRR